MRIGDRQIANGAPCYVIAEIGANHNRDMVVARSAVPCVAAQSSQCERFVIGSAIGVRIGRASG